MRIDESGHHYPAPSINARGLGTRLKLYLGRATGGRDLPIAHEHSAIGDHFKLAHLDPDARPDCPRKRDKLRRAAYQ
jgi:hypothetical protein